MLFLYLVLLQRIHIRQCFGTDIVQYSYLQFLNHILRFLSLRPRECQPILDILFRTFGFLDPNFLIIWLSNISVLSVPDKGYYVPDEGYYVPDKGYSRNVSCALILISTVLLVMKKTRQTKHFPTSLARDSYRNVNVSRKKIESEFLSLIRKFICNQILIPYVK